MKEEGTVRDPNTPDPLPRWGVNSVSDDRHLHTQLPPPDDVDDREDKGEK